MTYSYSLGLTKSNVFLQVSSNPGKSRQIWPTVSASTTRTTETKKY